MTGFVPARLMGAFEPPPPKHPTRPHRKNPYLDDSPPPRALLEANLARAHAELQGLADALVACARETRYGRFTDLGLMQRYYHQRDVVLGLTSGLSGHREGAA